jgi:phosphoglycolate phosphatase-like HAD superfamily hydrolase
MCRRNAEVGHDLEFRFSELVRVLSHRLGINVGREVLTEAFVASELDAEFSSQLVDPEVANLLSKLKQEGRKIAVVSDFYLGREMMERLLTHHNLSAFVDYVFVSSDYFKTKRSGQLYSIVLSKLNALPTDCVMIGDNPESDVRIPQSIGIEAVGLDRSAVHARYVNQFSGLKEGQRSISEVRKILTASKDPEQSVSRLHMLAATYYLFIERLESAVAQAGFRRLLFLSREGQFLKRLFDTYQAHQRRANPFLDTQYLVVSRKSTFLPALRPLEQEDFHTLFRQYQRISGRDFISNLNLDNELERILRQDIGESFDQRQEWYSGSSVHQQILANDHFRHIYENVRTEQARALAQYLVQTAGEGESRIALVDVGWKGTIQDHLFLAGRGKIEYHGFYLGLVAPGLDVLGNNKRGLLFNLHGESSPAYKIFNENRALFEISLGASHGSASRYLLNLGGVAEPELDSFDREKELFVRVVEPLQARIADTFEHLCRALSCTHLRMEDFAAEVLSAHADLVFSPTRCELDLFRSLFHVENFGQLGTSTFDQEPRLSMRERIAAARRLVEGDESILNNAWWPPLTLDNLGLGTMIPWYARKRRQVLGEQQ